MPDTRSVDAVKGKIALITGCTGGIGRAAALRLAGLGCHIAVHYNSAESIAVELVGKLKELGVRAEAFQADFSSYDGVQALHTAVVTSLGHPDILFNNAGVTTKMIGPEGNIEDVSPEAFEATWRTNTGTHYLLTQLCIPHMVSQRFGRIVFCSSVAAGTGGVVGPHYASSKSAMHGLLHWIANRYAKDGLTCNAIAPALVIETSMFHDPPEQLKARIPVGRFGMPNEMASVVELLVTNSYLTNKVREIIVADGGMTPTAF